MKFQKIEAFEKHFKDSLQALAPIYLVVCPKEAERKKILHSLIQFLEKECDYQRSVFVKDAIAHVNAASLFSGKMAALFDGVEQLGKNEVALLSSYVARPNPEAHLILGAASSKYVADLYKKGKKEMVILDLSSEKPWEEKERLKKWVVSVILSKKKQITPDGIEALFAIASQNRLLLQQEIDKLVCYVGERGQITREDITAICSPSIEANFFQLAQKIVWGGLDQVPPKCDTAMLFPLIGSLRYQLEMGLKIAALIQKNASPEIIAKEFPQLRRGALQQCLDGVKRRGLPFFKEGLRALFALEYGAKTSLGSPDILFSTFCAHIGICL